MCAGARERAVRAGGAAVPQRRARELEVDLVQESLSPFKSPTCKIGAI